MNKPGKIKQIYTLSNQLWYKFLIFCLYKEDHYTVRNKGDLDSKAI